jgi:hypothetical protein
METTSETALRVDLRETNGSWHVVVEREGSRRELEGLDELIRYLQGLAAGSEKRPARGLR